MPSFGYMRDPDDKGHLIPNPETAPYVKKIFNWRANGIGPTEIANRLNAAGVPTPAGYKKIKYSSRLIERDVWNISTVRKILTNRIYTGDMVQHTQTKVNYKSKKKIALDEALWDIVENTHEPLIDRETFDYIQILRKRNDRNYKRKSGREKRLFEGKMYCSECGNRLSVYYRNKKDMWELNCNRYSRDPVRKRCSSHFYNYNYLEEQLIEAVDEDISNNLRKVDIKNLNNNIKKKVTIDTKDIDKIIKNLEIEKQKIRDRLSTLYTDRCNDIITPNIYKELSGEMEKELSDINFKIEEEKLKIYEIKNRASIIPDYTKKILELLNLKKKRKELYDYIIDKIVIDNKRNISITYKYNVIPQKKFTYDESRHPNPFRRKKKK